MGGKEGVEDVWQRVWFDAGAVVLHRYADAARLAVAQLGTDGYRAACGHRFYGVDGDMRDSLSKSSGVGDDRRKTARERALDANASGAERVAQHSEGRLDHVAKVDDFLAGILAVDVAVYAVNEL